MSHQQIGAMVGADNEGIVGIGDAVLFGQYQTVAVSTLQDGEELPVVAIELSGRLNKTEDTIGVVYLMSLMDAGMVAGALADAARRIGGTAETDFRVGFSEATP